MTTVMADLYSPELLNLAAGIPHAGRLTQPDGSATAHSKLCGSVVSVDVNLCNGIVTGFAQDVKACLLGQAAASIVGRNVVGAHEDELRKLGRTMRAMLKEGGPAPQGSWARLALLEPVREYRARHASTLLVFDALDAALDDAARERTARHAG